jgi:hypothetical protein
MRQVKGVKVVVDNLLLVDSTRQSLDPALLKLPAFLQNTFSRPWGVYKDFKNSMMASWSSPFSFSNF